MTEEKYIGWALHQQTHRCTGDGTEDRNDWRCNGKIKHRQWRPADENPPVLRVYKRCADCAALVWAGMS